MKEESVIKYYVLCTKLKDLIRKGWQDWNIQRDRVESVAEHIYGTQMLAISMYSEYNYDINILKVILMLAIHETEENIIGDLTLFDINKQEKKGIGHEAIFDVFSSLTNKEELINLVLEFDECMTKEAKFAFWCDKLECDIMSKLYDEENCIDLTKQDNNKTFFNDDVQTLLKTEKSFSGMWLKFGQQRYNYDENFFDVSSFVKTNSILKYKK